MFTTPYIASNFPLYAEKEKDYTYNFLSNLAKENNIDYTIDIFPFYGSDIGAASSAGVDFKGALVGTGVSASHGMERTHIKGIENTLKLIYLYLVD